MRTTNCENITYPCSGIRSYSCASHLNQLMIVCFPLRFHILQKSHFPCLGSSFWCPISPLLLWRIQMSQESFRQQQVDRGNQFTREQIQSLYVAICIRGLPYMTSELKGGGGQEIPQIRGQTVCILRTERGGRDKKYINSLAVIYGSPLNQREWKSAELMKSKCRSCCNGSVCLFGLRNWFVKSTRFATTASGDL